ncbi:aminodeoxychorismate synthase component I [Amycolatopsis sp., V23-08]|uniref:aminodeoxychorismate synthase n=1 Tax=Amycolatopsis heterodermiae TaxID=3110235 RepID=A0ABU5R8N4_9PSEU|nr:aminodeoxychorismate synthase component I [Amycolatopsis sp., V23-08]MEA5362603.1 aminodeoxychorismate synthase component I [Amycolatopsis sp., V23-08]
MNTLLIDNHDSFTYNLHHYLTEINGTEPVVVENDDPRWSASLPDGFDNMVISPGPGTPERAEDFGVCAAVVRAARLPILGICLGFQGIGVGSGAQVRRAAEPRHGRVSMVGHPGTGLFAGIPSPFRAVRYHSLVLDGIPDSLEVTARAEDGVPMGIAHRRLPLWGVQFHPESIHTEHGRLLLRNFRDLTHAWWREHRRVTPGGRGRPVLRPVKPRPAPEAAPAFQVAVRTVPTGWDGERAFHELFRGRASAFWLDSASGGRFSIMGDGTGPWARTVTADVAAGTVTVTRRGGAGPVRETIASGFFDWLDADLRRYRVTRKPDLGTGFALGWVGYLGYELKAETGGTAAHRSAIPDAELVFADRAVVLDHREGTTHVLALVPEEDPASSAAAQDAWLDETVERLRAVATTALPPPEPIPRDVSLELRYDREPYIKKIAGCQEKIAIGESYEVCLTNTAVARGAFDPWECYRLLRRISPAPFAAFLSFGDTSVLSASPERFLRVDSTGRTESAPIKGTRARGSTPEEDRLLAAELAASEKDRSENLMIVDLVRNDLSRTAVPGSVTVPSLFAVESHPTVHQLVSTITARLREGCSAVDCVRAAFPGGSMTGAPKQRSMEIIDSLEDGPRGIYSGAIGYFSLTGAADLSIVIRTAVVRPGELSYGIGGAVVALSDPDEEYEETAVKAIPLLRLLHTGFPGSRR